MKKIKLKHNGFTLVEAMVAMAIIGVLASIALPAYQNYRAKAKFTEIIASLDPLKQAIEICVQTAECLFTTNGTAYRPYQFGSIEHAAPVPGEGLNGTGVVINLIGMDYSENPDGSPRWANVKFSRLPIPAGNLVNPKSVLQGNLTYTHMPQTANAVSFNFTTQMDEFTGTVNSKINIVLNASLTEGYGNMPSVKFTFEGGCKTFASGPLC